MNCQNLMMLKLVRLSFVLDSCFELKFINNSGAQFEGDLGEILALGAEISPYFGLREKWESP